MTVVFRFLFIALITTLLLIGCSAATSRTSAGEANQISTATGYLGKGETNGAYWPTETWRECRPEAVGMDSAKLQKAIEYAASPNYNTDGLMVIRKGYIVAEAYLEDFKIDSLHVSHSMAKSFTSSLVGIAIDKGYKKHQCKRADTPNQ